MSDKKYFGKATRPLNPVEIQLHNELGQTEQREAELKRRIEELEAVLKEIRGISSRWDFEVIVELVDGVI